MKSRLKFLIATIALSVAVLIAAGVTLAVWSSDNRSSGTLTAGSLSLSAHAANVRVYSAIPADADDDDVFFDENHSPYKYEQSTIQSSENKINFTRHEGSVSFNEKSIEIDGITPGDKVEFDIAVTSASTISFNYRAELYVDASDGETLLNQLNFSAGELGLLRQALPEDDEASDDGRAPAVLTDYTKWSTFSGNQTSIERIHVSISLPITADKGKGKTVKFYYVVRGIQNIDEQPDVAEVGDGEDTVAFKTLADAVNYAQGSGANEIRVTNSTVLEEGAVVISNALKFIGVADGDGNLPVIKGARITVADGAAAEFENVRFAGTGYIDITDCTALTLKNCTAEVNATRFFDTSTRSYLPDAAFIVSGSSLTPNRLILTNNKINTIDGAATCLRTRLQNGSEISNNVIGSTERSYGGTAVVALNGAEDEATVKLTGNAVYGNTAFSLGNTRGSGRFTVISENNEVTGNSFAGGTANAALIDGGSKLNGKELVCTDIKHEGLLFACVDATLDNLHRISSGKLVLSENENYTDFFNRYASAGTLDKNALSVYSDGKLIGYINSSDNELGYVINYV